MRRRLIAVHHRLSGRTGHRFHEALGLVAEAAARKLELILLIHEGAEAAVRAALPQARAVLHDPVFRADLSFDARTDDFVAMLHAHLDAPARAGDVVLMTVATQCEARAFARWVGERPPEAQPHVVLLFHSDRWNRYGADERERQGIELERAARDVAPRIAATPGRSARFVLGATAPGLAREISDLLRAPVDHAPMPLVYDRFPIDRSAAASDPPRVGLLGGARPEKGFAQVRALVAATLRLSNVRFVVQMANELLDAGALADLAGLADEQAVEALPGALSEEDYARVFASCDVLLLPYDRVPYRQRSSGIFSEAVASGKPVVVPDRCWMGALVAGGVAAGIAYAGNGAEAAATGIAECVSRLPALRLHARALAEPWRRRESLGAFLDWVERKTGDD